MRRIPMLLLVPLLVGSKSRPVHELLPPDPREDIALGVTVDGNIPAAMDTRSGTIVAPDPRRPPMQTEATYSSGVTETDDAKFAPDRNTSRPEVQSYDDPFTPSVAPFKRLSIFDAVSPRYELYVRENKLVSFALTRASAAGDDLFYADMIVDLAPGRRVRIPTPGPSARLVRARLGLLDTEIGATFFRDGAENWFVEGGGQGGGKARLVAQISVPRAAFGGELADVPWTELPKLPPLPENVARAAAEVSKVIGVSRGQSPRQVVSKLVAYFRGFADSDEPPTGRGDIYLDLALSKKGVCRHRAFAFLVTAQSLGIPTRAVFNEAHAWVEVFDGTLYRRIDLGGAGRISDPARVRADTRNPHQAPGDSFSWPQGSERGTDMMEDARRRQEASSPPASAGRDGGAQGSGVDAGVDGASGPTTDSRPRSQIVLSVAQSNVLRGAALKIRGNVTASGSCPSTPVEILLRPQKEPERTVSLGMLATDADGALQGELLVSGSVPVGDYEVIAMTRGSATCGAGSSEP